MISRIKAQRHLETKQFQGLDAKRILLAHVQDSLQEYLGYTDKECQEVAARLSHVHCQITDDAIGLYRAEVNENPMYEQVTELRQANKRLEEKYEQEVAASMEKDNEIENLRTKLQALEKRNHKKD
jgi:hypothetical protein